MASLSESATILWVHPDDIDVGGRPPGQNIQHIQAHSLAEACDLCETLPIDIVVCAPRLGDGTADELFARTMRRSPTTARILLVDDATLPSWRARGCRLAGAIIAKTAASGVVMLARWMNFRRTPPVATTAS